MSNAFANAWSSAWGWSIRRSPIMVLWRSMRGLGRPNRDAFALLGAADLPEPVNQQIRTTISRTKLWRDEREQVARELIAHAQDALEAGRSPEHIARTFGDPRRVAKLLRRSMKRKRPVYWQLYRFSKRAVGVMVLILLVGYGWLAVRYYTAQPEVRINYAAKLAERNEGYREDQKSWPVIAEVGFEWAKLSHVLREQQEERWSSAGADAPRAGLTLIPAIDPEHPDYAFTAEAARSFEPQIAMVRQAAERPIFGLPVGYETTEVQWRGESFTRDIVPASERDFVERSTIEILLPQLAPTRSLAELLVFDARLALREGDSGRAIEDYIAALNLARQCNAEPFLISRLVGLGIHHLCMNEVQWMVRAYPDVFTRDDLARLAHTHAQLADQRGMGLETERYAFSDFIQRIYSDDGRGSGHLTAEGMEWLRQWETSFSSRDADESSESLRTVTMPLSLVASNDRAAELAIYHGTLDRIETAIERGPEWAPLAWSVDREAQEKYGNLSENPLRYSLVSIMLPALGQAANRSYRHRQNEDAFALMLAIESYRLTAGELPDTLAVLDARFLPAVPEDHMDPGQPVKYLRFGTDYLLYSVGSDGDDDKGVPPAPSGEQYNPMPESQFGLRFTQAYSPTTGEPLFEPSGKPVLGEPEGPDGDWILIDTRPRADQTASE